MKNNKRILSITLHHELDTDPDLSFLGEYSGNAKNDNSIDRKERGDMDQHEYRYFTPAMTGEETGNPDSPEQDYARMESYNAQNWYMMGVFATAEVILANGVIQSIRSGGLWGIESDSDRDHIADVEKDELADLAEQLEAAGFSKRAVARALLSVETED